MGREVRWIRAAVTALALVLGSCGTTSFVAPVRTVVDLIPGVSPPIPLAACVYVPPEAKAYVCHAPIPLGEWTYALGRDLEPAAHAAFRQVFERVVSVGGPGQFEGCDVLIETRFNEGATAVKISFSSIESSVTVSFRVSNPNGVLWERETTGRLSTPGTKEAMAEHGKSLADAVTQGAVAMHSELRSPDFLAKVRPPAPPPPEAAPPPPPPPPPPAASGCTKDIDCKGDRICVDGRCRAP